MFRRYSFLQPSVTLEKLLFFIYNSFFFTYTVRDGELVPICRYVQHVVWEKKMRKLQLGRSLFEMLMILIVIAIIAMGGVWGVEYAFNQYTTNQIEQEVVSQISSISMRRRNIRVQENGEISSATPTKYITSQRMSADRKTIILTADGISEAVCNSLVNSENQSGYSVRVKGNTGTCKEEDNVIEFISASRLERNIQEVESSSCSGVSKVYACDGKDEYDANGCRTREVLRCANGQGCSCSGGECSCICDEPDPYCLDFDNRTCSCMKCEIGFGVSLEDNLCHQCPAISKCVTMGENCTCAECEVGYTYRGKRCEQCNKQKCKTYSSGCICSECEVEDGWRLIDGECQDCSKKTPHCLTDHFEATSCRCTACQAGYKLIDGRCVACAALPGCVSGKYNGSCGCTECLSNYIGPINGNCCPVKAGCEDYENDCSCKTCQNDYLKKDGNCCKKQAGCIGENYNSVCGCTSCDSTRYALKVGGVCEDCKATGSSGVSNCAKYSNTCSECAECESGFVSSPDKKRCCPVIPNCKSNRYNNNCQCEECQATDNNGQVLSLSQDGRGCCRTKDYCKTYIGASDSNGFCSCSSCMVGFKLGQGSYSGSCVGCDVTHCSGYSYLNSEPCKCIQCEGDDYAVNASGNQCCSKITNCGSYDDSCKCTSCNVNSHNEQTYLSSGRSLCCDGISGCNKYNDTNCNCTGCEAGKTLSSGGIGYCCPTETNCSAYQNPYENPSEGCTCTACSKGFLTLQKHCKECTVINYCTLYNDDCQCETCGEDKILSPGKTNCCTPQEGCTAYNDECQCTAVEEGFALSEDGWSCRKKSHCTRYSGNTCQCISCDNAYRVSGGVCVACPNVQNCQTYDPECKCTGCTTGKSPSSDGSVCCANISDCGTYNNSCKCVSCNFNDSLSRPRHPTLAGEHCCNEIPYCLSYNEDCTCAHCVPGRGPAGHNVCDECATISHCQNYDNYCYCEQCQSGYERDIGRGVSCCERKEGCLAYNEYDCACRSCQRGYTLLLNGTCFKNCPPRYNMAYDYGGNLTCCPPIDGCEEYDAASLNGCGCSLCKRGYRLSNRVCVPETCYNGNNSYSPKSNCLSYAVNSCECIKCRSEYVLDDGNCETCENHYCSGNDDCCSGYFCSYESEQTGKCRPITSVPEIATQTRGNATYLTGAASGVYYKTAYNWCDAKGYLHASRAAVGCGSTASGSSCSSPINLTYSGYVYWLRTGNFWDTTPRYVFYPSSQEMESETDFANKHTIMCYSGQIPNTSCTPVEGCSIYNDSCGCAQCEDGNTLTVNGRCCPTIETCSSYNNSCVCTSYNPCSYGEVKLNGTCVDSCPTGYTEKTDGEIKYCCPSDCQTYGFQGDRCVCTSCKTGSSLSVDGVCVTNSNNSCTDSSNCRRTEFCKDGVCVPRSNFQTITKDHGSLRFMRIVNHGNTWTWKESKDFCESNGYKMAARRIFSCGSVYQNTCEPAKEIFSSDAAWNGEFYLEPYQGSTSDPNGVAYFIRLDTTSSYSNGRIDSVPMVYYYPTGPLCYTRTNCPNSVENCQARDMLTCHCTQCATGYYLTEDEECLQYPNCAVTDPKEHCIEYDENCNCIVCDSNKYTVNAGVCVPSCLPAGAAACTQNSECCTGTFCAFDNATGGTEAEKGIGVCRSLSDYPTNNLLTRVGSTKRDWIMTQDKMGSWWSAQNYCAAQNYSAATISVLGCTSGYCTDRGVAGWGKAGTAFRALQAGGWKGSSKINWLQDMDSTNAYDINMSKSSSVISNATHNTSDFYALCYKAAGNGCTMGTDNCSTYNPSNCNCVGCNSGWRLNGTACEQCPVVAGCATYDPDCKCTSCSSGYNFYGGTCYSTCSSSSQCASDYFCAFPNATNCSKGSGVCLPISAYGPLSVSSGDGKKWIRSTSKSHATFGALNWWSADSWCKRQNNKQLAKADDLGCGDLASASVSYCTVSGNTDSVGRTGSSLAALQGNGLTSGWHWLGNEYGSCNVGGVNFETSAISYDGQYNSHYALCTCPPITNCTAYSDTDCSCTACSTGYVLSGGNCDNCDTNYIKVDGKCYPSCTDNSGCATTDFCAFQVPDSCQQKGNGACLPMGAATSKTITANGVQSYWVKTDTLDNLSWWSAESWCARKGMELAERKDIGCQNCGTGGLNYCTQEGCSSSEGSGIAYGTSALYQLQTTSPVWHGTSGCYWLKDHDSSCKGFYVYIGNAYIYKGEHNISKRGALCTCPEVENCSAYSSTCACTGCVEGYHIEGDHCVLTCSATNEDCTSNDDCCNDTDYCSFSGVSCSSDNPSTTGKCRPISERTPKKLLVNVSSNLREWIQTTTGSMNWWTAKNWCERQGYTMASLSALGCSTSTCTNGATMLALQNGGWTTNYNWVSESGSSCHAYSARTSDRTVQNNEKQSQVSQDVALCYRASTKCTANVENCTTYNFDTCACLACSGTNLLVSGKCCAPVPNCKSGSSYYDNTCACTECDTGYTKVNGKCYKTCTDNTGCASTEFCAFPNATSGADQGLGACVPTSAFASTSASTNDGRTWIRSTTKTNATYGNMNWWSAENWCARQKTGTTALQMPNATDLGCSEPSSSEPYYCTGSSGLSASGSIFRQLQDAGWRTGVDDYAWLSDSYGDTNRWLTYFNNSHVSYNGRNNPYYALCSCPFIRNCATYNNSCICTECIGDYIQKDYPVHHYVVNRECIRCSKYHCIEFDPTMGCACLECDDGFILSEGKTCIFGGTGGRPSTNNPCTTNADCVDTQEFCHFADGSTSPTNGKCKLIGEFGVRKKVLSDNNKWARSLRAMNWWSAKNFCAYLADSGKTYSMVTRADVGCGTVGADGYCTDNGQEGVPAKSGSTLAKLQTEGTPWQHGSHWLDETSGSEKYSVRFGTSAVESFAPSSVDEDDWQGYALCLRETCSPMAGCLVRDYDTCKCTTCDTASGYKMQQGYCVTSCSGGYSAYPADGGNVCCPAHCQNNHTITGNMCACTACETGYFLNEETGYCGACVVTGCANSYDASCNCMLCNVGYKLEGGSCTACSVDHCATETSYDSSCNCTLCSPGFKVQAGSCTACPAVDHCASSTSYDGTCACTECAEGYTLYNGACYPSCTSNAGCSSSQFCSFENATTCTAGASDLSGFCMPKTTYTAEGKTVTFGGITRRWAKSTEPMNKWTAENWCDRNKMRLVSRSELGCGSVTYNSYCTAVNGSSISGTAYAGSALNKIQTTSPAWSDWGWNSDNYSTCNPYITGLADSKISSSAQTDRTRYAFCTCKDITGCISYNSDCECTACDTGYKVQSGSCVACSVSHCASETSYDSSCNCTACEPGWKVQNGACVACSTVDHCATETSYDSSCGCTACATGYTAYNGACYKACPDSSECSSGEFCAFETPTSTTAHGPGACLPLADFGKSTATANMPNSSVTMTWTRSTSKMTHWSAYEYCSVLRRYPAYLSDIGCNETIGTCSSSTLTSLRSQWSNTDPHWTNDDYEQGYMTLRFNNGAVAASDSNATNYAFCKCNVDSNCVAYDGDCVCTQCIADITNEDYPIHYYFNGNYCTSCQIPYCATYGSGCTCSTCETGFTLSGGSCVVTGSGSSSGTACTSNVQCSSTEFCKYDGGNGSNGTNGHCTSISSVGVSKKTLSDSSKWARSLTVMNWWSAVNFCERQTDGGKMYALVTRSDIGCSTVGAGGYCTTSGSADMPGKSGTALYRLQMESPTWQRGSHWLGEVNGTKRYTIRLGNSFVADGDPDGYGTTNWHGFALCKKLTCEPLTGCNNYDYSTCTCSTCASGYKKEDGTCVTSCSSGYTTYSAHTGYCCPAHCESNHTISGNSCVCTACDAGYKLEGGACVACPAVDHCASSTSYDSTCKCTSCATNYTKVNGTCYPKCTNNSNCAATEFCAFPNATLDDQGDGACVPASAYSPDTKTIGARKWVRSISGSSVYGGMTLGGANNWCQRQGNKRLATTADLGCPGASSGSTCSGSNLTALRNAGWTSDYCWIGDGNINSGDPNILMLDSGSLANFDHDFHNRALCTCEEVNNCTSYSDSDCSCTACAAGYKLEGGACVACPSVSHCSSSTSYDSTCKCTSCQTNYSVSQNGICCSNISSCGSYNSSCTCASCNDSKVASNDRLACCTNNVTYCSSYSNTCKCATCDFNTSANKRRFPTVSGSKCCDEIGSCLAYNEDCTCAHCLPGYGPAGGSTCAQCSTIANCSEYDENCHCASCNMGYEADGRRVSCCQAKEGCTSYSDSCACLTCEEGYSLLTDGTCFKNCPANYMMALDYGGNLTCCPKVDGCEEHSGAASINGSWGCGCLSCRAGYNLVNGVCVSESCSNTPPANCANYGIDCVCIQCQNGYVTDGIGGCEVCNGHECGNNDQCCEGYFCSYEEGQTGKCRQISTVSSIGTQSVGNATYMTAASSGVYYGTAYNWCVAKGYLLASRAAIGCGTVASGSSCSSPVNVNYGTYTYWLRSGEEPWGGVDSHYTYNADMHLIGSQTDYAAKHPIICYKGQVPNVSCTPIEGCSIYDDYCQCATCVPGYVEGGNRCCPYIEGCYEYTNSCACEPESLGSCNNGRYRENGACVDACSNGYVVQQNPGNSTNYCCPSNCQTYSFENGTCRCTLCAGGLSLSSDGICVGNTGSNCTTSENCKSTDFCKSGVCTPKSNYNMITKMYNSRQYMTITNYDMNWSWQDAKDWCEANDYKMATRYALGCSTVGSGSICNSALTAIGGDSTWNGGYYLEISNLASSEAYTLTLSTGNYGNENNGKINTAPMMYYYVIGPLCYRDLGCSYGSSSLCVEYEPFTCRCVRCQDGYHWTDNDGCEPNPNCAVTNPKEHCVEYNEDCSCKVCENTMYHLQNGSCVYQCLSVDTTGCTQNSDCCGENFCAFNNPTGGTNAKKGVGTCKATTAYAAVSPAMLTKVGSTKLEWIRTSNEMPTWWTTKSWCEAKGYTMATRSIIGCGSVGSSGYCTDTGKSGLGKAGTAWRALQVGGWEWASGDKWLESTGSGDDVTTAYYILPSTSSSKVEETTRNSSTKYGLCYKVYTGSCAMNVDHCSSYNANTCACLGCESGWKKTGSGTSATCTACETKTGCIAYSTSCACLACSSNYNLISGECVDASCTSNDDCETNYFCAFDNPTGCYHDTKGPGRCILTSTYSATIKTTNGRKWAKSGSNLTWWTAENWCKRQKAADGTTTLQLLTREELGCDGVASDEYCTDSGNSGRPGKTGSALALIQTGGWNSGTYWTGENANTCNAYRVSLNNSQIGSDAHNSNLVPALCSCPTIKNCTNYDDSCGCTACGNSMTLSGGKCISATGGYCQTNDDCGASDFCATPADPAEPNAGGICTALWSSQAQTVNGRKWVRSTNGATNNPLWKYAENWCKRQKAGDGVTPLQLVSRASLGCEGINGNTCSGTNLAALRNGGWTSGRAWLSDSYDSSHKSDINFTNGYVNYDGSLAPNDGHEALCSCPEISGCSVYNNSCGCATCKTQQGCTAYDSNCKCTSCNGTLIEGVCDPNGGCSAENPVLQTHPTTGQEMCCPAHCSGYNYDNNVCTCSGCQSGYTLVNGGCVLTGGGCRRNEDCAQPGFCMFENPTSTDPVYGRGDGVCADGRDAGSTKVLNDQTWMTTSAMSIWSAQNWCKLKGKRLATRADIDCSNVSPSPSTVCSSSTLDSLRSGWGSDQHWLDEDYDPNSNVGVSFSYGHIDLYNRQTGRHKPLCTCPLIANCTLYSETSCDCLACYGVAVSNGRCLSPTGGSCNSNDDCSSSTDYCAFQETTGCEDGNKGTGVCTVADSLSGSSLTVNGRKWTISNYPVNWWTAENWCKRQTAADGVTPLTPITRADLGCSGIDTGEYCTTAATSSGSARPGSNLRALQDAGWTNSTSYWLKEMYSGNTNCNAYSVRFSDSAISTPARNSSYNALCTCPPISHCVGYDDSCGCTQCDNGYVSNGACVACGTQVSNCNGYNNNCQCTSCSSGYRLNNGACNACSGTGTSCTDNTTCCEGTYCKKTSATAGTCQTLPTTASVLTKVGTTTTEWVKTTSSVGTWWADENLCDALGYSQASRSSLNCGTLSYCTDSGTSTGYGKAGTAFRALQVGGWTSGYWWLEGDTSNTSKAYRIYSTTSQGAVATANKTTTSYYGLCYKSYTPGSGNCAMDVENCSSYDPDTCACKGCNSGWKKAGSGTSTYCTACTAKTNCTTYNPSCYCTSCNTGYTLVGSGSNARCCSSAIANCSTYNDNCTCKTCASEYVLSSSGSKCCSKIDYCTSYDDNCQCTACSPSGYEDCFETMGNKCCEKLKYCNSYDSNCNCTSCSMEGCTSFDTTHNGCYCASCASGYGLWEGSCIECKTSAPARCSNFDGCLCRGCSFGMNCLGYCTSFEGAGCEVWGYTNGAGGTTCDLGLLDFD